MVSERSTLDRGIKDSAIIKGSLSSAETKTFNKIKRSLLRAFINPNHATKMLIDLSALEYISYLRTVADPLPKGRSKIAKSLIDCLGELDMTPRAKKSSEVSMTLSQIFKNISQGEK